MAKTILGIDIGHDTLKLALVNGSQIKQTVSIPMSNSVVRDGVITAPEMFGDLLRTILKDNGIKCDGASFALSDSSVFTRNVTSPKMSEKQLLVNIPYEFKDYITSDLKDYVFDYAMITQPQNNDNAKEKNQGKEKKQKKEKAKKGENAQVAENPQEAEQTSETENNQVLDNTTSYDLTDTMQYLAVAAPVSLLDNLRVVCKKAGIRFLGAAPDICCYISLIRNMKDQNRPASGEYCILDLGYKEVRMHMFKNDVNIATRVLDFGMAVIDDVISGLYEIDNKTAHTYLLTNRDSCQQNDQCLSEYNNMAVELMRAINFYNFSNPDSQLSDIWLCGGGTVIPALESAVESNLDLQIHKAHELVGSQIKDCESYVEAIGAAMILSGR